MSKTALSKQLVTIKTDCEVPNTLADYRYRIDLDKLEQEEDYYEMDL